MLNPELLNPKTLNPKLLSLFVIQGKEVKKNINSISDLLMDFGQDLCDDGTRLVKDLRNHEKKLKAMARKLLVINCFKSQSQLPQNGWPGFNQLDPATESAEMDDQCSKIHEEAPWDRSGLNRCVALNLC